MTLGARGCLLVSNEEPAPRRFSVPEAARRGAVVDTIGAGDAFLGALAHRLAAGTPLAEALPTAVFAATLSVQKRGAQASYPTREELPDDFGIS